MLALKPRSRDLGDFTVRRVLPDPRRPMVGPFIFFDHMGPTEFEAGKGIDVRPHPHICLSTVTYLFEGELVHRDSLGIHQVIRPGEVNWMTAGKGIVHSERSPENRQGGERIHGIQCWVALPETHEETEPAFTHYPKDELPILEKDGASLVLIAGEAFGLRSPVKTHSPLYYAHVEMETGANMSLPQDYEDSAAYIASGSVEVDGTPYEEGHMLIGEPGQHFELQAVSPTRVLLLGGEPLGPRHIWWNFVASSEARIEKAKEDWQTRRFPEVPGETEFIPLPE